MPAGRGGSERLDIFIPLVVVSGIAVGCCKRPYRYPSPSLVSGTSSEKVQ